MKILFAIVLCFTSLYAIDLNLPSSAAANAANNLQLLVPSASSSNPAAMKSGFESSATYLFNLKELPLYNSHISYKFGNYRFKLGYTFLDHALYDEKIGIFAGNYAFKNIRLGFAVRHLSTDVKSYQQASALIYDAGLLWKVKNVTTAFAVKNFLISEFEETKLPIFYLWESSLQLSEKSNISLGLEKQDEFDFSLKFAALYKVIKQFSLICGYQYQPDRFGLGAIFHLRKFQIEYSTRTHLYLDLTHYITFRYAL